MPPLQHFPLVLPALLVTALAAPAQVQGVQALDQVTVPGKVLILVADDLGIDQVRSYGVGSDYPTTPNLCKLASEGVQFRNVWSNPLCSPTRAGLQTGRNAPRTGIGMIIDNTGTSTDDLALAVAEVTLPELVRGGPGDYATAAIGKWHLGNDTVGGPFAPNLAGYDHFAGVLTNFLPGEGYSHYTKVEDGVATLETSYVTTATVDWALDWLADVDPTRPWLLYVAFNAPHTPFHAPPSELHTVDLSGAGAPFEDPRPYFRAMVQAMDTEIGRLLEAVDDDTTVIFLGDNGTLPAVVLPPFDPTHAKATLFEGGVHVPLIVRGPQVAQPGSECSALVSTQDVFATVAELAGVDLAEAFPGLRHDSVSFLPYLFDPDTPSRRQFLQAHLFNPNGQGFAPLAQACSVPAGPVCQADLGFGGTTTALLSLCADTLLYGGAKAQLKLTGALPGSGGTLFMSPVSNPMATPFGTVVTTPAALIQTIQIDDAGEFSTELVTGPGIALYGKSAPKLYYQALVFDDADFQATNAVELKLENTYIAAARGARYKLIFNAMTCVEEFYDLELDPFEHSPLDLGALTGAQQRNYAALKRELRP